MFKLESYIAPLLMGYIDKYVKLQQEDFTLSLWGGDAVLNKLDLRLDAIESALNLPITFKSGHIYELRIHVPWTKLGSEPVVITINTIECILKLRDSASDDADSASLKSSGSGNKLATQGKPRHKRQTEADELPPGYLQSLVNRIVNNVNIIINNLILKFVEDDIVLSVNVKSAECYSVDQDWKRAFIELALPELVLHRVFDFNDLTVCLDKRNASGKIETYQDPLLYRCSVTCRIHMIYDSLHAKLPAITKFNLLCEKLDISLTDTQVPMFFRLIELCVALYYGTLELPGSAAAPPEEGQVVTRPSEDQLGSDEVEVGGDGEGWASWAWSYVPQILPSSEEEEYEEEARRKKAPPPVLSVGFYIKKASVIFKLTEAVAESATYSGSGRVTFAPCIIWTADGISLEVLIQGLVFFNVQFGVTSTAMAVQGEAMCGVNDVANATRNPCFCRSGTPLEEKHQPLIGYMTGSLFDPGGAENQNDRPTYIFTEDEHLQHYTETYSLVKFGAFWMDYLFTMDEQDDKGEGQSSNHSQSQVEENVKENSSIRFLIGPSHIIVSGSMVQRLHKFIYCMGCHDYEPYSKPQKEIVDETRAPPTEEQVRALEEYLPTRSYHITWTKPVIWIQANDLPTYDVRKRKIISQRKMKKKSKAPTVQPPSGPVALPLCVLQAERLEFQVTSAMYPRRLVQQVSKLAAPSTNLLHHCHTHTYIKVFGVQAGIAKVEASGQVTPVQNIIQPWSGAWYKRTLLFPMYWKNPLQLRRECMYELPHLTVNLTKPQVMVMMYIASTWGDPAPNPSKLQDTSLPEDVFRVSEIRVNRKHPVLEVSISGVEVRECSTPAVWAATGTLTAMQAMVVHVDAGHDSITPLMYGPLDTQAVPSHEFFRQAGPKTDDLNKDCVTFTIQLPYQPEMPAAPAAFMLDIHGVAATLDPILYDWLVYTPTPTRNPATPAPPRGSTLQPKTSVDPSVQESPSPLKNSANSQGSQSGSTQTVPTDGQTQSHTFSATVPRTASKMDVTTEEVGTEDGQTEEEESSGWGHWLAARFPLVKIMEVQVDVQTCCMFFPAKHVRLNEVTMNIPHNLRACFTAGTLPDTLVVCWPHLHVASAGQRCSASVMEIPIRTLEHSVSGERLPWSVQMSQCSVYTLHSSRHTHYILKPAAISATIAVTTKYHPPTSDNITSLGLCIHADMETVVMTCSHKQIQQLYDLAIHTITVGNQLLRSLDQQMVTMVRTEKTPSTTTTVSVLPASIQLRPTTNNQTVSTSSQLEPPVTITETSESMSRETTPIRDLEDLSKVKLSLWLQWTLPKLTCRVYSKDDLNQDIRVETEIEDVATSVDVQDVYSKVKVKVGALNAHHYVKRAGSEMWTKGDHEGLLMTCGDELARNVQVLSNKTWSSHGQHQGNLFTSADTKPRDKTHGFLTITFTRALRKNVKKKMKKMMLEGIMEDGSPPPAQVYLNELCVDLQPSDVVLNCPVLSHVLQMLTLEPASCQGNSARSASQAEKSGSRKETLAAPLLTSSFLPLIYINAANFRLFIPRCDSVAQQHVEGDREKKGLTPEKDTGFSAGHQHDVCILHMRALTLTPQADNPLPRVVVEKDLYRRAVHSGIVSQPGSQIEDRQYQLDIKGLGLSTGHWRDLVMETNTKDEEKLSVQHPALEWNNLRSQRLEKEEVRLIPIAMAFDLRVVAAPAILYIPPSTLEEPKEAVLVCGYSVEMNATSDMDFYLSNSQVKLALDIYQTNIAALMGAAMVTAGKKGKVNRERVREERPDESHLHDSGVESETSTFVPRRPPVVITPAEASRSESELQGSPQGQEFVPFDVLLTAGKISFMTYMHREGPSAEQRNTAGILPGNENCQIKKSDLEYKNTDAPLTLTPADSGIDLGSQGSGEGQVTEETVKESVCVIPFLYATFAQPHTMVMMQRANQKVELSCYDVILKGAKQGYSFTDDVRIIPDVTDFAIHWVETKPGEVNAKTGIPPSLYTLRATDFLHQPAEVLIELKRPLKLNISISRIQQLMEFVDDLLPNVTHLVDKQASHVSSEQGSKPGKPHQPKVLETTVSQPPEAFKALTRIGSIAVCTVQTLIAMETVMHEKTPAVQLSVSEMEGRLDITPGNPGSLSEVNVSLGVTDFLVKTCYAHRWRPLIGPFPINLSVNARWMAHSGPAYLPSMLCYLETGVVMVTFGQEHVMCLQLILEHVDDYIKSLGEQTEGTKEPSDNNLPKDKLRPSRDLETSTDDLRAGQFNYNTTDSGPQLLPAVHEILFSMDYDDGHATMTWSYPEPRVVTFLQVTPVPFTLPQELDTRFIDEDLKVPCLLQYWNPLRRDFMDYAAFSLSENEAASIDLPEVMTLTSNDDVVAAQVWRALILHPRDKQELSETPEDVSEENVEPLVSPMTLAASLRVDSCHAPSLIPLIQIALSASVLQVRFASHLQHLGSETPNKLTPYKLDPSYGSDDHEYAILTMESPALTVVTLAGQHPRVTTQGNTTIQCDILEYRNLTLRPLVEQVDMEACAAWHINPEQVVFDTDIEVAPVYIRVGEGATHTLNTAAQAWAQVDRTKADHVLPHYYLICNNTMDVLQVAQVDTDEGIRLASLEVHPYTWRTHKTQQLLHLTLEGLGGQWSEPINIDDVGSSVQVIEHKGQKVTLLVTVKKLSGVQRQVVVSGQVLVASRLSHHLEVKVITQKAGVKDDRSAVLEAEGTLPSYVTELEDVRALRVRLHGLKTAWSQDVVVTGEKSKETKLVKVPLADRGSFIHIWCHVFRQDHGRVSQILVLFTPLFIARTHLPSVLTMNIETSRLKSHHQVKLQGQGHEDQIHITGGDMTHNITFQISPSQQPSSPPIALSSGMIEQVPRQSLDEPDLNQLMYAWRDDCSQRWPYNDIEEAVTPEPLKPPLSPSGGKQKVTKEVVMQTPSSGDLIEQPNIDLQITLQQRWVGCNTLLINIAPHWLLVNDSDLDLVVIENNEQQWQLPRKQTFAPPAFQEAFRLGLVLDNRLHLSESVTLSEQETPFRYLQGDEDVLYRQGHLKVTVPVVVNNTVTKLCYLTLHSTSQHAMRVVTVRETFILANVSRADLQVQCFTLPLSDVKLNLDHEAAVTLESKFDLRCHDNHPVCPLPFWTKSPPPESMQTMAEEDVSHVQYLCLRHLTREVEPSPWAIPVRVRATEVGVRTNVSLPWGGNTYTTRSCVITAQQRAGMTYLTVVEDREPSIELHNNCNFSIAYGQTLVGVTSEGTTIQEEAELTTHIPTLPPGGSSFYAFPACNSHFPEVSPQPDPPKLHLSGFYGDGLGAQKLYWSNGIDITSEHDIFVHIPEISDVKVHIEKVGHTTHIFIDPVSRAEISAKEIRSRIRGKETTVILEAKKEKPAEKDVVKEEKVHTQSHGRTRTESMSSGKGVKPLKPFLMKVTGVCENLSFILLDEFSDLATTSELLRATATNLCVLYYPSDLYDPFHLMRPHIKYSLGLSCGDLQIDNQMYGLSNYDFPVVFLKQGQLSEPDFGKRFFQLTPAERFTEVKQRSLLTLQMALCTDLKARQTSMLGVCVTLKPVSVFVEDTFVYDILQRLGRFTRTKLSVDKKQPIRELHIPSEVWCTAMALSHPTRMDHLTIEPIELLLSVHASLKLFIAADNSPLSFSRFDKRSLFTNASQLVRVVAMHYASGALYRAGWVVGSLEILGNPTGFVRNVGMGVSDMLWLPYEGITRGPGAFVGGVTRGMGSLVKHISTGALTSVTNFASSMSRNMDRLSLDTAHCQRQEESRRRKPQGVSDGLVQGLAGFGISVLGAIAGIADQPLQSLTTAATVPSSPARHATGIVSGVGKGIVGAFTKPIGGAAELVSQTGMGLLHGAGLAEVPTPQHVAITEQNSGAINSSLKFMQKLLLTVPNAAVVAVLDGVQLDPDSTQSSTPVSLLLTPEILFVVGAHEDMTRQAYAVSEISCHGNRGDASVLCISVCGKKALAPEGAPSQNPWLEEFSPQTPEEQVTSKDKVAAFIGATTGSSALYSQVTTQRCDVRATAVRGPSTREPHIEFQVDGRMRDLFIAQFTSTKRRVLSQGFPV